MSVDLEKFNKFKAEAEELYKTFGETNCPYLGTKVGFNAKGLEHIKFKARSVARSTQDQYVRFRLLKLAPDIVRKSHTLQEYFKTKKFESLKIGSEWEQKMVNITYYGFVAIVADMRIKVVLKQIDDGKIFFWSIIPFWKNEQKNTPNINKKILHVGDLEID